VQLRTDLWAKAAPKLEFFDSPKLNIYILQVMSIALQTYCSPQYLYHLLPGVARKTRNSDGSFEQQVLIEDNIAEARLLEEILKEAKHKQFSLLHTKRLKEGLQFLGDQAFHVILLDLTLPDSQGLASLEPLIAQFPQIPIVVLTNSSDEELALEAVRRGAQDYLTKRQVNLDVLVRSICYSIERKQTQEALRESKEALEMRFQQSTQELAKAQEMNKLKNEFVSMISHDFRNPLNTILLSAGLLEDSSDYLTKEQQMLS
jgi:DNA-binding response OmpR family regulator